MLRKTRCCAAGFEWLAILSARLWLSTACVRRLCRAKSHCYRYSLSHRSLRVVHVSLLSLSACPLSVWVVAVRSNTSSPQSLSVVPRYEMTGMFRLRYPDEQAPNEGQGIPWDPHVIPQLSGIIVHRSSLIVHRSSFIVHRSPSETRTARPLLQGDAGLQPLVGCALGDWSLVDKSILVPISLPSL